AAYALPQGSRQDWFDVTHSGQLVGVGVLDQIGPLSQANVTVPVNLTGLPPAAEIFLVIDPNQLLLMPHHLSAAAAGGITDLQAGGKIVSFTFDGTYETVNGLSDQPFQYLPGSINQLIVDGGIGGNTFYVQSLGAGTPVVINTGPNDIVI